MGLAAAVGGAAVVGAISSRNATKKSLKASNKAADKSSAATKAAANTARSDVNRLFDSAKTASQQGFQDAAKIFGDVVPQQSNVFQQGNVNAQNTILQGLPQIQNALLGGNVDLSGLQASQQAQPDFGFFNQFIPPEESQIIPPTTNLTNEQMGVGGVLPPNDAFIGPIRKDFFNTVNDPLNFSNLRGFDPSVFRRVR